MRGQWLIPVWKVLFFAAAEKFWLERRIVRLKLWSSRTRFVLEVRCFSFHNMFA